MLTYKVTFSCNPNDLSPAACSTRTVSVFSLYEIKAACAQARGFTGPRENITIVSMHLVREQVYTVTMTETLWTVEVDLCLVRPPTVQRTSRVILMAPDATSAELMAISMATQIHNAEMPVGSRIIDWEE